MDFLLVLNMRISSLSLVLIAALFSLPSRAQGQSQQDQLFQRVLKGTKCEQVPNNGRYCRYKVGDVLSFSIKDVGGVDTVVGFHRSNIASELYAVLYFGCVVVVPGEAHPRNYSKDYGVHISPKTGLAYMTSWECRATLQQ